jgi:flagellar biosynthesis protein FliP
MNASKRLRRPSAKARYRELLNLALTIALSLAVCLVSWRATNSFAQENGRSKPGSKPARALSNRADFAEGPRDRAAPAFRQADQENVLPQADAAPEAVGLPAALQPEQLVSPGGLSSTINLLVLMTVLSLAPSILIMTTCFIRFVIVLGLLRQALGTQQLPPNQVIIALCMFLTFMVMAPVWRQSYEEGIRPYTQPAEGEDPPTLAETFERSVGPIREFMGRQIEEADNSETVWTLLEYQRPSTAKDADGRDDLPERYQDVPLDTLVSAYMLSELKVAFVIGFQIYLPFLVIDMVVATVLMGMGMMMLPPTLVSFPFKLLLFVLIDGWALTVGMLLDSVRPFG